MLWKKQLCAVSSLSNPPSSGKLWWWFCEAGRFYPLLEHDIWTRKHTGETSVLMTTYEMGKQLGLWKEIIVSNFREEIKTVAFFCHWTVVFLFFFIKVIINMYKESQHMKFLLQKREATSNHKQEPSWTPVSSEHMLCSCFGEGGNLHSDSPRVYIQMVLNQ